MNQARPKIPGMTLVAERPHNKHGSSVFVRDGLKVNIISVCEEENVEFITVELPVVVVHSLYKPPPEPFLLPPLERRIKPHIVIGDFNSHSTLWGYTTTDSDGEAVEQWADSNRLSLIHNAKNCRKSFNSAIWKKGYNPDLIFVSSNISDMCEKSVLDPIPRTQHRPIWAWNWTMSVVDGESRRMACPRGVSSHQSCSTFTLMTSQSTMERVTSYTQMIYVSQLSTLHSQK